MDPYIIPIVDALIPIIWYIDTYDTIQTIFFCLMVHVFSLCSSCGFKFFFKHKYISNHNLHTIFSLSKFKHRIRFGHKFATFFIQGLIVTLDNSMVIKSHFVGERHLAIMAFTIVFNCIKELTCNNKKVINVNYQG